MHKPCSKIDQQIKPSLGRCKEKADLTLSVLI